MRHVGFKLLLCLATTASATFGIAIGAGAAGAAVKHGGTVNIVVVNQPWLAIDPALANGGGYQEMPAIYGQLFDAGPHNTIVDDLASGYSFSDHNLLLTITIRSGVKFSDGTRFTAAAVASSFQRDLNPANGCTCIGQFTPVSSITTKGDNVLVHLSEPYAPIIDAFIGNAPNWVVDPTALASMGEAAYEQDPVGAGPYKVVSNTQGSSMVLTKNPHYWEKGHPYLSGLTFTEVGNDQSAYSSLLSGQSQLEMGMTTSSIILGAKSQGSLSVQLLPGLGVNAVMFNTAKPPFNNILAREAVIYATDQAQILQDAAPGFGSVVEEVQGPSGFFFEKSVPGYQKFNLAKAKALVQQIGGLSFQLQSFNTTGAVLDDELLQNQLQQAGITVTIAPVATSTLNANEAAGNWQAHALSVGNTEPAVGTSGLLARFYTGSLSSGVNDPSLDGLINRSIQLVSSATRQKVMDQIYEYITQNAYAEPLFSPYVGVIASSSISGWRGTTASNATTVQIFYQNIAFK